MGGAGSSGATMSAPLNFIRCPTCGTYLNQGESNQHLEHEARVSALRSQQELDQRLFEERNKFLYSQTEQLNNRTRQLNYDIEHLNENKMDNEDNEILQNERYFTYNQYCRKHRSYQCDECIERVRSMIKVKTDNQNLPAIIANPSDFQDVDGESVKKNFEDQVIFIQKSLGLSDKEIEKIKIKELPVRMREAQEKVTVGTMRSLMNERIHIKGVIEKIGSFFTKKF